MHVTGLWPAFDAVTVTDAPGMRLATLNVGTSSAVMPSPTAPLSDSIAKVTTGGAITDQALVMLLVFPATSVPVTTRRLTPDGNDEYAGEHAPAEVPLRAHVYVTA